MSSSTWQVSASACGAARGGRGRRTRALVGGGLVAERDRGLHERGVGVADRLNLARGLQAVEPAGVDLALAQLVAAEQLEQEALVGGPLLDVDHRVGDGRRRRAIACSRVSPWAMILAIIESNSAGTVSPSATPESTRMPGPAGRRSSEMRPGDGEKPRPGSSALRRTSMAWPRGGGGSPSSVPPAATCSCSARGRAGDRLGHGVLDLEARVDLHEAELAAVGLVQELDGAGALVAGLEREPLRGLGELGLLLGREHRAGGLLDHLLVAALVEQSRTPSAHTPPSPSAISWTSTWRAAPTRRSISTLGSPNADSASERARSIA
jgi:hypothetical protein